MMISMRHDNDYKNHDHYPDNKDHDHNNNNNNNDNDQKSWWWNSEQPESGGAAQMDPVAVTRPPKKVTS